MILLLLAAFVAGLLIVQLSLSGSADTAADEGPIVEQAGIIDSESAASQPLGPGPGASANSTGSDSTDFAGLAAGAGSSFYISFADSPNSSGDTGGSVPPVDQPDAPGALSGTVVDATIPGSSPIPRITVYLARSDGVFTGATARTGDDGSFLFDGLAPGEYKLYFFDLAGTWKAAWYGGPAAPAGPLVNVVSGRDTHIVQGLNLADPEDGAISGKITDAAGNGVAGVDVLAYFVDEAAGVHLLLKGFAVTDAEGNYEVSGLPPSDSTASGGGVNHVTGYKVQFVPAGETYSSQWYDGQPTHMTAKLMQLKPAEKLSGIDAILTGGGTISGRITLEDGQPASWTLVDIFDASGVIVDTQITAGDGAYKSDILPAGIYHLRAVPQSREYSVKWYSNGHDLPSSAAIQVFAGQDTGGIDVVLERVASAPVATGEPSVGEAETHVPIDAGIDETGGVETADQTGSGEIEDETDGGETADETDGAEIEEEPAADDGAVLSEDENGEVQENEEDLSASGVSGLGIPGALPSRP